jgi:hypothetical protein
MGSGFHVSKLPVDHELHGTVALHHLISYIFKNCLNVSVIQVPELWEDVMKPVVNRVQVFFVLALMCVLIPSVAANSISAAIIQSPDASPGEIISFDVIVTNLAPVVLDHCNFYFSVGPYVDLIWILGTVDESLHISSFSSSCDPPPQFGVSHFFSMPILGKIREDAPPGSLIESSFQIETVADEDPAGEWCQGCWKDSAYTTSSTIVDPAPVPEFPGIVVPAALLTGLGITALWKKRN